MASKDSTKAILFLFLILLSCILSATGTRSNYSPPPPPPPSPPPPSGGGGSTSPPPSSGGSPPATCPKDALKLGVCVNVLPGLVGVVIGKPPVTPCCSLLEGLVDLEAAVCLCTAIKANISNILNLKLNVALSLILNACGRTPPTGFTCA